MNSVGSQKVVARFFEVLEELRRQKKIRGMKTFTDLYGIDRRNMAKLKKDYSRDIFQVEWLGVLVEVYGVNAEWLLTGKKGMFTR